MNAFPHRMLLSILKLAQTTADLAGCEEIQSVHLAEALQYRLKLISPILVLIVISANT